ncbi:MAG: DoxX family protein [Gemmatimonadaceae bacterium]
MSAPSATILRSAPLMTSPDAATPTWARWTGRILTGIAVLFLAFDTAIKLVGAKAAVDGTVQVGFAPHLVLTLGLIELVCLVLYLVPRTAPLGAVLWTGYFGGAIAMHLRLGNPLFSHTLFPIYIAALLWAGLYLRDERVRALLRPAR